MHREVFAGRTGELLTVGEMPGVTVDDAILYTDPARAEVDMVFQFEHVALDQEDGDKWRPKKLLLTELKQTLGRWQEGPGRARLEQPVLGQPRPGPRRVPLRRRRPVPRALRQDARRHPAPAPRHALRLPGRRTRHDQHDLRRDQRLPRHRGPQPPPRSHHPPGPHRRRSPRRPRAAEPGQRPDPGPVGRLPARRLHHRRPWIAVNPNANHINAAAQVDDPDSVYSFYRQVIALRHAEPVVSHGNFTMLLPDDPHVYAFTRSAPERPASGVGQLLRPGPDGGARRRSPWGDAELVLGNYPSDGGAPAASPAVGAEGLPRRSNPA